MKRVWIVFGRFNPPTIGHKKMIDQLQKLSGNDDYMIWPTWKNHKKTDPLEHPDKVGWMIKMFPEHSTHIKSDRSLRTLPFVLQHLMGEGYTDVVIVCGSDRTTAMEFAVKFNRKETGDGQAYYAFDTIKINSTGLNRDPDSDGAEGMSASKMRAAAKKVDTVNFLKGVEGLLNTSDALTLMEDVREGLGL